MKRIYEPDAYSDVPLKGCFWTGTAPSPKWDNLQAAHITDVAIIGAGFTGLNAALHLAQNGTAVTVLDAKSPGWGASGRNGGFCCLGGGNSSTAALDQRYGEAARREYHQTEIDAVDHVAALLKIHGIDADVHSAGETILAHRPKDWEDLQKNAAAVQDEYGVDPVLIPEPDLAHQGLAGPFYGALTVPIGFALNPRKYALGLAQAAQTAGARVFADSPVTAMTQNEHFHLATPNGKIMAKSVIIATNGYSSEDIPHWLRARFMPVQSSVLVTRPLTDTEIAAAGWHSDQMAYDTRNLLHYFRLMPDRRFLFGMRGGIFATKASEARLQRKIRGDFEQMFPAWAGVETPHYWSGLVCMTRKRMPFVGAVPGASGLFASLAYHGNGVAMGSYCGTQIAKLVLGQAPDIAPPLGAVPKRIPLARKRRILLPPLYAKYALQDR